MKKKTKEMVLVKSSQETDCIIFNIFCIGEYNWTQLKVSEDSLWNIKYNNNNNSYIYHHGITCYTDN